VSPFNSTEKFINNEYFLTHQQEELKTDVLRIITDFSKANFISITGSAGTGKTLLTYDIAKEIKKSGKNVLIIHCGYLNEGQMKLTQEHAWTITAIKHYSGYNFSHYALVIIDEAQRIYANQLVAIVQQIQSMNGNCLFSYDNAQTLSLQEEGNNIAQKISEIPSIVSYKLSEKIRTNKEIASFIKMLFDKNKNSDLSNENNIELNYFSNNDDAKEFLSVLDDQGWEVIRFTPSQYNQEHHEQYALYTADTSHKVIGQEYDKVAVTIDRHFFYNDKGKLMYRGSAYYYPVKMLFQNITRTRKKLHIVIINNSELLERCLNILNK
jgi:Cdc6-like AAA superfamily ATPase